MKTDTQHLDFLLSQYVDGNLDGPHKKVLEQQLAVDPVARALLKDHTEVQELLEDWGSRIPLIDWNQFDETLAAKLELEAAPAVQRTVAWRRWMRPMAAAAALLFAAAVGYTWHGSTPVSTGGGSGSGAVAVTPMKSVEIGQPVAGPSMASVTIDESGGLAKGPATWQVTDPLAVKIDNSPMGVAGLGRPGKIFNPMVPMVGSTHAEAPPATQPGLDLLR